LPNLWLIRAEKLARWLENIFLIIMLIGLMSLASAQIVLRNFFSVGLPWADGLIRLAVLWLALLGAIAASRDGKHISINIADRVLPEPLKRPAKIIVDLFTMTVAGWIAWYAVVFVRDSYTFGDVLLSNWPAWIFQSILPVAFALICYRYALRALRDIRGVG